MLLLLQFFLGYQNCYLSQNEAGEVAKWKQHQALMLPAWLKVGIVWDEP